MAFHLLQLEDKGTPQFEKGKDEIKETKKKLNEYQNQLIQLASVQREIP